MKKYLIVLYISLMSSWVCMAATNFNLMRQNLRDKVTLGPLDYDPDEPPMRTYLDGIASSARKAQISMRHDTTFLWDEWPLLTGVPSYTPFHVHYSYQRLETMARAYAYPGSSCYHDAQLLADIRYGLGLLYRIAYNENTPMCGNWWEWRIGNTYTYANTVSILYDQLTPEEIQQFNLGGARHIREFCKKGNMTFANLADVCLNLFFIGVLTDSDEDIRTALEQMIPAYVDKTTVYQRVAANAAHDQIIRDQSMYQHNTLVWKKEGLYEDGTFIQHIAIPYIGTYGGMQIIDLASMMYVIEGTDYRIAQPIVDIWPTWLEKTYVPELYKGEIMLMFMGRGNARNPYKSARVVALNMIKTAELMTDSVRRNRIIRIGADLIAHDRHCASPYDDMAPLPVYKHMVDQALALAPSLPMQDEFSLVLAAGDRLIHQRPSWRFGLAMSSNRIGKYEAFVRTDKSENNYAWYTGDGMTYLYNDHDPMQYWQYIPLMNHYRVPGTTVDMIPREFCGSGMILFDHQSKAADIARAGGVMMDGLYSSAMMQLLASRSDLMAKKSWFCFDNEVVCLGSDINLDADREVITTVENRQFTRSMYVNGKNIGRPSEKVYDKVTCAYLDSTGGYYFPIPVMLHANVGDNAFCEFWLSHGTAPQGATYAYVLLPEMSQKEVKSYCKKPQVEILSNTPSLQAVHHKSLGITAFNFWSAGTYGILSSDGVAAIMMRQNGDNLYLSVSEPTWQRSSQVLTLDGQWNLVSAVPDDNIVVRNDGDKTHVTLATSYRLGMTQQLVLTKKKTDSPVSSSIAPALNYLDVMESLLSAEEIVQLKSIYAPRIVAAPIEDARKSLMVMPDGELRNYGKVDYSATNPDGRRAYLSSRDCGLSWKLHYSSPQAMGECTYVPQAQKYMRVWTDIKDSTGTWILSSTSGPDDTHFTRTLVSHRLYNDCFPISQSRYTSRLYATGQVANPSDSRILDPVFVFSDDYGQTWDTVLLPTPSVYPVTAPDLSSRWAYCGVEPVVTETAPNQMMALLRNASNSFYWTFSQDNGTTWSSLSVSPFHGDATTPYLLTLRDGRVLAFWNNTIPLPENNHSAPELDEDAKSGRWEDAFTNRDASHVAISEDGGRTWTGARELLLSVIRDRSDFRYYGSMESSHDKSVHQFQAIELPFGKILVVIGQNEASRRMLIFDVDWLYEIYRHEDFMSGMEGVTSHTFLRSLSGCTLAAAGNGHCQWNRMAGAVMAPDPAGQPRDVVHVSRQDDPRLISPTQGITWNFPASHDGRVMAEVYLKEDAVRLSLCDAWYTPSDPSLNERAQLSIVLDQSVLTPGQYHQLLIQFNTDNRSAVLCVDGEVYQSYHMKDMSSLGLSYLILQCEATEPSDGFYVRLLEKDDFR